MIRLSTATILVLLLVAPGVALASPDYTTDASLVNAGFAAKNSGDFVTAAQDFSIAAKAGNTQAEEQLGGLYLNGQGVAQNCSLAKHWFGLSALQGDTQAIYNIGVFYEHGICVPQNYAAAMTLYKAAGQRGWAEADNNVGNMYDQSEGVPRDDAEAIKWFTLAAAQNNTVAQLNLGLLAEAGLGETRNLVQADMWMRLATKNASTSQLKLMCAEKLTALQESMTSAQITQGNALAASWVPHS